MKKIKRMVVTCPSSYKLIGFFFYYLKILKIELFLSVSYEIGFLIIINIIDNYIFNDINSRSNLTFQVAALRLKKAKLAWNQL